MIDQPVSPSTCHVVEWVTASGSFLVASQPDPIYFWRVKNRMGKNWQNLFISPPYV